MKRFGIIVASLLLCMGQLLFSGCGKEKTPQSATTEGTESTDQPIGGTDESGYQRDDLGTLDYGNKPVNLLCWSDRSCQEFDSAGKNADIVNNAIFDRNRTVEQRLKVNLTFTLKPGNYENMGTFRTTVETDALNEKVYDLYGCYGPLASDLAMAGYITDLGALRALNFRQPWWPSDIVSNLSLGNRLYFATGDISTNLLWMMQITLFNANFKESAGITEDFYGLVQEKQWTLEKFMEICNGIYTGGSEQTLQDSYGLVTHANVYDAFVIGAGIKAIDKDENDMPILSDTYGNARTEKLISKLGMWLNDSADVFIGRKGGGKNAFTDPRQLFEEGKSLFIVDKLYIVQSGALRDMTDKYGILPMPLFEGQTEYHTDIANTHTQYCIANKDSESMEMCGAVLECLASESHRQVIPVLYFKVMKLRYGVDQQTSAMYDLLRGAITFDFGKIFQRVFADSKGGNSATREAYMTAIDKKYNWNTRYTELKPIIEGKLGEITFNLG